MRSLLATALWVVCLSAADRKLELRGRIEPPVPNASVGVMGAYSPFVTSTTADRSGRFRVKNLKPGSYTLAISAPGKGVHRQTVEVSPSLADPKGRVEVVVRFEPSREGSGFARRRHTVGIRELAIPDQARREYGNAIKKLEKRDVEGAVRSLERAVEIAPQFAAAWNHLGTIAYQTGRYQDAEKYFRRALEERQDLYPALVNLGGVLLNLQKYAEALDYNREAVRLRERDALANAQLGMNYYSLGQDESAIRYLNEAKRLDPGHFSNPQFVLADIYVRRGEREKAAAELEDFLKRRPDTAGAAKLREHIEKLRSAR